VPGSDLKPATVGREAKLQTEELVGHHNCQQPAITTVPTGLGTTCEDGEMVGPGVAGEDFGL